MTEVTAPLSSERGWSKNEKRLFRDQASLLILWIAVIALCGACNERRESSYRSLADAIAAGEATRGWIPDWLPPSSHAIKLAYDPSSPRTWCAFEFSPDDSQRLREKLTRVDALPSRVRGIGNPDLSWWPEFLTGDLDGGGPQKRGFDVYVMTETDIGT